MTDDGRVPIADVLPGMTIHPLDPGWQPIEGFVLIKCLDDSGGPSWSYRTTAALNREELLGALMVHAHLLRNELVDEWESD